jgi:cobalt-zinc-cadmium efflux system outer membrane protein
MLFQQAYDKFENDKFKAGDINATDYLVQVEQTLDSEIAAKDLHAKAWEAWFNWLSH